MDLTYMPGELDVKNAKKGNGSDMKREHDSVDDFEHLDPDLSPGDGHVKDKFDMKGDIKDYNVNTDLIEKSHGDEFGLPSKSVDLLSGKLSPDSNLLSEFGLESKQIKTEVDLHFGNEGKSSLLDFETNNDNFVSEIGGGISDDLNKSFISAEISDNRAKTEKEIPILDIKFDDSDKKTTESHTTDIQGTAGKEIDLSLTGFSDDLKSMKEDDALPQYDIKLERRESPEKEECIIEKELDVNEPEFQDQQDEDFLPPTVEKSVTPEPKTVSHEDISDLKQSANLIGSPADLKETPRVEEPEKPEMFTKPISPVSKEDTKPVVKKMSMSDLDDIIGPEDVFKRIGLDAWFTPERLHPKVEALVYWRDPKKSGVVFGGGMVILLSLCFMSLISVIAYTSLFALTGAICFRIYKNILQAVQKTSEGHPFKEFLDLELSLPQDKVREVVDTAVVHLNAAVVELRRLFLVEDLIDSIKFGVCLWCLTYVGAIFNGMTLVILAFVALFTVPKIYENNKASIDQYIDMGRSKVAEITSKVKAAMPIGKKEPEKDKEQ